MNQSDDTNRQLREHAEKLLQERADPTPDTSTVDYQRIIHDLKVYQIELELQNEELRNTQKQLEDSRNQYASLYNEAPVGYVTLNSNGVILQANQTYCRMVNRDYQQVINLSFSEFLDDSDATIFLSRFNAFFKMPVDKRMDLKLVKQREKETYVRITGSRKTNKEAPLKPVADLPKLLLIITDISHEKRIELTLKESEYNYRTLANTGQALIWTSGPDKLCNYFNDVWLKFTGRTFEQEAGNGWAEGVHPDDLERCITIYTTSFDKREPFSMDYRLRRADGAYRWLQDDGTPRYDSKGNFTGYIGFCLDITSLKQLQVELEEKSQELDQYFQSSLDLLCIASNTGEFIRLNPEWENVLGYPIQELEGKRYLDLIHPDDQNATLSVVNKLMNQQHVLSFENRYRCRNGSYRWIEWRSRPNGDRIYAVARDTTSRREAEEASRQIRHNYESFFNTIDDFIFVMDDKEAIVHVNENVIKRLGYREDELTGQPILLLHPPEQRAEAKTILEKMIQGTVDCCPVPLMTKTGKQIPVETRIRKGMWDNKPAVFGVAKDISSIKLSEEKFSKVFYVNPSACGLCNLATGKYTEVNDTFYSMFGYDRDEVIDKSALELGIIDQATKEIIEHKTSRGEKILNLEADMTTKNGQVKHVLLSSEDIQLQDLKLRYVVMSDITDRKVAEKSLQENETRLRELNATKDKFFSIIAHDLKGPFNSILGFSDLLNERIESNDYDGIGQFAGIIHKSAQKAVDLLMNLLEWSRTQTGRMEFARQFFDLTALVNEVIELLEGTARHKSIIIHNQGHRTIAAYADKAMISTVLRNLLSNAVKFSHPGGTVTVKITETTEEIKTEIADNGIGMKPDELRRLFRIEESFTTKGTQNEQGTGLGLILSKEFIDKHGGNLFAQSIPGKGSTFTFIIPNG